MRRTRLKYYLRALGTGIVVTALLMGYSQKTPAQMTDEEIRQRAAQLGMVEQQGVLSELTGTSAQSEETGETQDTADSQESEEIQGTAEPQEPEETQGTAVSREPEETQGTAASQEPEESQDTSKLQESQQTEETEENLVTLVIVRGDTSVSVSRALEEAGLVEDYRTYDRFLCDGGYDKSINPGTYEIPADATDEEIARIITKKR